MLQAAPDARRCSVEPRDDSAANLGALREGRADFAIVQSDWLLHAYQGTSRFQETGRDENLRVVLPLHGEALTIITNAESGIRTVADFKGKKVNLGPAETYQRLFMETLLGVYGLTKKDLGEDVTLSLADQGKALCAGNIGVASMVTAHPSGLVAQMARRCGVVVLPLTGDGIDKLIASRPELTRLSIPGNYSGNSAAAPSFGLRAVLVARSTVPAAAVSAMVDVVLKNFEVLRQYHPVLSTIDRNEIRAIDLGVPAHDGAAAVFAPK